MNKLNLNKETVSQMDRTEMADVHGGLDICISSCKRGTRKKKDCCKEGGGLTISFDSTN